jgi:hypothetical protein
VAYFGRPLTVGSLFIMLSVRGVNKADLSKNPDGVFADKRRLFLLIVGGCFATAGGVILTVVNLAAIRNLFS